MGLFGRRKDQQDGNEAAQEMPWDRSPSIYAHILEHIQPGKSGITEGGETLPDEERLASASNVRWTAGAMDGVLSHHWGGSPDEENVTALLNLVRNYCAAPTATNKSRVYAAIVEKGIVGIIDPFIERLTQQDDINHDRLYDLARSFTTEAPDREPVKFGIAILGLFGQPQDAELFRILGRHDEFTLFCAVALSSTGEDGESELWELAQNVDGWGRIQIVERLSKTENPEIMDWMLREGFKNSIMYEYLAYTCATTGGLHSALSRADVDDELFAAAGEILQALINGGPAEDIDNYEDGAVVTRRYLDLVEQRDKMLQHFLTVAAIRDFLSDEEADWSSRADRGWTPEERSRMRAQCDAIISDPAWIDRAMEGLRSPNEHVFYEADRTSQVLGIEVSQIHWERLCESPLEPGRWYNVMKSCDADRIDEIVALAEKQLPLEEIASSPGNELGLGPDWKGHSCLDYILQELGRFPGHGVTLVATGLRSPVIRNRNMAVRAISDWGEGNWSDSMKILIEEALDNEPNDSVRECIRKVLSGERLA